jgi:integrase
MPKISFRIRSNKPQAGIYLYLYTAEKERFEFPVGISVRTAFWQKRHMRVLDSAPEASQINGMLENIVSHMIRYLNANGHLKLKKKELQAQVKLALGRPVNIEKRLSVQARNYVKQVPYLRSTISGGLGLTKNTERLYRRFAELVEEYDAFTNQPMMLSGLHKRCVDGFVRWMFEVKRYAVNNVGTQVKCIKTVSRNAHAEGMKVHHYALSLKTFGLARHERHMQIITQEEIEDLKDLYSTLSGLDRTVCAWMLIGLYTGQRVGDLLTLNPENIKRGKNGVLINVLQQKTKLQVTIGVKDSFVMDILENNFPRRINPVTFNRELKIVARLAGMTEVVTGRKVNPETRRKELGEYPKYSLLSAHDLRRSFATNLYGKVPTPLIMKMTGHQKEGNFLLYIGEHPNKDHYAEEFLSVLRDF